tara:strand:- start:104 stop:430 length:327 start_codon:yes stop_codon:yes gene_type:complete
MSWAGGVGVGCCNSARIRGGWIDGFEGHWEGDGEGGHRWDVGGWIGIAWDFWHDWVLSLVLIADTNGRPLKMTQLKNMSMRNCWIQRLFKDEAVECEGNIGWEFGIGR